MDRRVERAWTLLRALAHELRVERVTFMAGSLAYNAFVSLLPLLALLLFAVSETGNQGLEQSILELTDAAVTPGAGEVLVREVRAAAAEVSVVGGALLVWGALRIFRTLDTTFSDLYETGHRNSLLNQLLDGAIVFGSIAAVMLVAGAMESGVGATPGATVGWVGERILLVGGVALALSPMFYLFPDEPDLTVREVLPGLGVTSVGLVAFQSLFGLYLRFSSTAARESILASILVFLTWLYFTGLILLVGAAVNAVTSNRSHDVDVEPLFGGVAPESGGAGGSRPADERTVAALERLAAALPDAEGWTATVDDEPTTLPPPETADLDRRESRLPFIGDSVGLELTWRRADDEE